MRSTRLFRPTLALTLLLTAACAKEATAPGSPASNAEVFVSGKGLRKVFAAESPSNGIGLPYIGDMTVTSDGYIHAIWAFGLNGVNGASGTFASYRTKVGIARGDTVAAPIPSFLRTFNLSTVTVGCAGFGLVPYTDVLAYSNAGLIEGTSGWQALPNPGGVAKVYTNRSAACSSTYFNVLDTLTHVQGQFTVNGVLQPAGDKVLTPRTLTASLEVSPAGVPLAFVMDKYDTLSVINYTTGARLTSVSLPMIMRYIPANFPANYRPSVHIVTKLNRAGTSASGLINNVQGKVFSTFVYDIATNRLTVRNQNVVWDTSLYLTGLETFDDDGTVYYTSRFASTDVRRVTPTGGDQVYRAGVSTAGRVGFLKHVDNRLIVVLEASGDRNYSDSRGRARMVITVAE